MGLKKFLTHTIPIAGVLALGVNVPQKPISSSQSSLLSPPPKDYNIEMPLNSGNFDPYNEFPRPEAFEVNGVTTDSMRHSKFTLDFLLKNDGVQTHPSDVTNTKQIILYATAQGEWCSPCNYLHTHGFEKTLQDQVNASNGEVGVIEIRLPKSGTKPEIFNEDNAHYITFVPNVYICSNIDGTIRPIVELPEDVTKANKNLATLLHEVRTGKLPKFLHRDDFRNFQIAFSLNPQDTFPDHDRLAIALGQTIFEPDKFRYDSERNELIFTADLSDPRQFEFVSLFDASYGTAKTGRNVLSDINTMAVSYARRLMNKNPAFGEGTNWITREQGKINRESPNEPDHFKRADEFYEKASKITNGCVPPYIEPFVETYQKYVRDIVSGKISEIDIVSELVSPKMQEYLRNWASEENVSLRWHSAPSEQELIRRARQYRMSPQATKALISDVNRMRDAAATLDSLGINYVPPIFPREPIENLVNTSEKTVVVCDNPEYSSYITSAINFTPQIEPRKINQHGALPALLTLGEGSISSNERFTLLYVPAPGINFQIFTGPNDSAQSYFVPGFGGTTIGMSVYNRGNYVRYFPDDGKNNSVEEMIRTIKSN